jgi:hypothetical protein
MSVPLALACCLSALSPQGGDSTAPHVAEFRELGAEAKRDTVRGIVAKVALDPDPLVQQIVWLAKSFETYPIETPRPFHDPEVWAKGVAPKRTLVREGAPAHRKVREKFPAIEVLPDLHKAVRYDWGTGKVERAAAPLTDEQAFENLLRGYPPGADAAVAHVQEMLDRDRPHGAEAEYFEHLYADLDAKVYEGITIYEAWYSSELMDVPDVDAIPFAVQILKTREYVSPIPAGPHRTALYERIRTRALAFRKYRTLRESAAAAFVCARPLVDPLYEPLIPRLHCVFATSAGLAETVSWVRQLEGRDQFLAAIDRRMREDDGASKAGEERRARLIEMAGRIRDLALAGLEAAR